MENKGTRHAVLPLESVISISMHIYMVSSVSVGTSKKADRNMKISSSKYANFNRKEKRSHT